MKFPTCIEVESLCVTDPGVAPDFDGDGVTATASGGIDCLDDDPTTYPTNPEVCDADAHDEDCNPSTIGPDRDRDGELDASCCNLNIYSGELLCGLDCDDGNPSLGLLGKRCLADGRMEICRPNGTRTGAQWEAVSCGPGSTCVPQPDGTGVCQIH